mgnify:CR=1 FL=1
MSHFLVKRFSTGLTVLLIAATIAFALIANR